MTTSAPFYYFAQGYSCSAYGQGSYNSACATAPNNSSTGTPTPPPAHSGSLVNTGVAVVGIATLAAIIIFVTLVVRFWKKPKRSK